MPKTASLLIRLTPEDRARLDRHANRLFLDTSTWARQQLLIVLEDAETMPPRKPTEKPRKRA